MDHVPIYFKIEPNGSVTKNIDVCFGTVSVMFLEDDSWETG